MDIFTFKIKSLTVRWRKRWDKRVTMKMTDRMTMKVTDMSRDRDGRHTCTAPHQCERRGFQRFVFPTKNFNFLVSV